MSRAEAGLAKFLPLIVATALTPVIYVRQAQMLLLKVGEVLTGVFDTSVPAFPLAGMLFSLVFLAFRRREFEALLSDGRRDARVSVAGVAIALMPLLVTLLLGSATSSYAFAGVAVVTSWVGLVIALRPSLLRFLSPYLAIYLTAVGAVGILTTAFGDPLADVVAWISQGITTILQVPVQWSSVYLSFIAAGGNQVNLYISQECSGIASISIFLLVLALMHLDMKTSLRVSAAFAVGGSLLFLVLNSLRVVALVVAGVTAGEEAMWNLHGWLGYLLYIVGYLTLLIIYVRVRRGNIVPTQARIPGQIGTEPAKTKSP